MNNCLAHYYHNLQKHNIIPDQAQVIILKALAQLHNEIQRFLHKKKRLLTLLLHKSSAPRGIYLCGKVGIGKSMIMDLFYEHLPTNQKQKIHFHAFMLEIHHYLHEIRNIAKNDKHNIDLLTHAAKYIAQKTQVLYIDELQISDITDAMIVGKLFRELMAQNVIIVITSNFLPDELYLDGLQRGSFLPFIDLIKTEMQVLNMNANYDYRLSKLKSVDTTYYIYKEVIDSQKFILDSFVKLTDNSPAENRLLNINGRELICPITAADCAVFSFDQLCRAPLSSADYIAICQEFNLIIISEIPELTSAEHNEAKRFIHLVDAIYDHKKILLCSARAAIDSVYRSGRWHFEFLRTISRLHEMQSQDYLAKK